MATEEAIGKTPKTLSIGPYQYEVVFDGDASYDYHFFGVVLPMTKRIKLDPRQSNTELPQTLLHEIIHALGMAYERPEWRGHKLDEKQNITDKIDLMASAMLQFLRHNPEVVKWLELSK